MAKTNFINGNPSQGIMGTVVTAEFLNAVNNHYHTGLDEDGHGALAYAVDTGTINSYQISLTPELSTLITGMPIYFKASNTNTGPATLKIGNLNPVSIKKNVVQDLQPGDILAGEIVTVVYDGTNFQIVKPYIDNKTIYQETIQTATDNININNLDINNHKKYLITIKLKNLINGELSMFINNDETQTNYRNLLIQRRWGYAVAGDDRNNAYITYGLIAGKNTFIRGEIETFDGYVSGKFHITDNVQIFTNYYQFIKLDYLYTVQIVNVTSLKFVHSAGNGIGTGTEILIEKK